MARKPKLYQKLARRRGGVGTYFSLWLGADHVLQVEANMMTERYQRVWFRDIQGFMIRPNATAKACIWISAVVLVVFGALLSVADATVPVLITSMVIAAVVLLYGLLGARNCHFYVQTAVQQSEWKNLARYRKARKVIARLEPLILDAQRQQPASAEAMGANESAVSADEGNVAQSSAPSA